MKARVKLIEGMTFLAEGGSGHGIVVDAAADVGGRDLGMRPMEMLLSSLGSCSAIDVAMILRRMRQPLADLSVEIEGERATEPPKVFTAIHLHYRVVGKGLDPAKVQRAIDLSADKYCSASIMLAKTVPMTRDFEIVEPE